MSGQYSLNRISVTMRLGNEGTFNMSGFGSGAADNFFGYTFENPLVTELTGDYGDTEHSTMQLLNGTVNLRLLGTSQHIAPLLRYKNVQNSDFGKLKNISFLVFDRGVSGAREVVNIQGCSILNHPERQFYQSSSVMEWTFRASSIVETRGE